jgi:hypothetical protein
VHPFHHLTGCDEFRIPTLVYNQIDGSAASFLISMRLDDPYACARGNSQNSCLDPKTKRFAEPSVWLGDILWIDQLVVPTFTQIRLDVHDCSVSIDLDV